jgi:hypothetical protein
MSKRARAQAWLAGCPKPCCGAAWQDRQLSARIPTAVRIACVMAAWAQSIDSRHRRLSLAAAGLARTVRRAVGAGRVLAGRPVGWVHRARRMSWKGVEWHLVRSPLFTQMYAEPCGRHLELVQDKWGNALYAVQSIPLKGMWLSRVVHWLACMHGMCRTVRRCGAGAACIGTACAVARLTCLVALSWNC